MILFLAQLFILRWLLRFAVRLARWTIALVVMVAAAPVTVVAVAALTGAWLRGWPPARLRRASVWSLPMTGVYLAVQAATTRSLPAVTRAPSSSWAPIGCPLLELGGSRGDGLWRSPEDGLDDTTAPGFSGDTDWQQGDAPQSAG